MVSLHTAGMKNAPDLNQLSEQQLRDLAAQLRKVWNVEFDDAQAIARWATQ